LYDMGGAQLCKNVQNLEKEAEGQKAQLDQQLNQVPKNHPQRRMFEAQIEQQKQQFNPAQMRHQIEQKLRSEELDVFVPISAQELYNGVAKKEFFFKRLVICRGCREDPTTPECVECGRCQPEKIQIPKYANTPFGRQVVGVKEKEQESRERCREVPMKMELKVPKGAKEGHTMKHKSDIGHMVPGKMPGNVVFKVRRGSPDDTYTIAENDLHTVLKMSLEQALFGFSFAWTHLGDEKVSIARKDKVTTPDDVVRVPSKGLVDSDTKKRGDLFVRLSVGMPTLEKGTKQWSMKATDMEKQEPTLFKEDEVELKDGATWRRWVVREQSKAVKVAAKAKDEKKDEL